MHNHQQLQFPENFNTANQHSCLLNRKQARIASSIAIAAIASAWMTVVISALLNPWFRITGNALSDLGGGNMLVNGHPAPTDPWIYNGGLILTGILIIGFASYSQISIDRKMENAGLSFFIVSGLFLMLIGIYHEGTYPHDFVSIWFFILASLSYLVVGLSLLAGHKEHGAAILLIVILSWIAYALVKWQSVAEDEIFGIAVIDAVVCIHLHTYMLRSSAKEE